jgi:urea transport system substrate-binding protein
MVCGLQWRWHELRIRHLGTTNDPMEAHYIGFNMWVKAVEKVKTTDPDKVTALNE